MQDYAKHAIQTKKQTDKQTLRSKERIMFVIGNGRRNLPSDALHIPPVSPLGARARVQGIRLEREGLTVKQLINMNGKICEKIGEFSIIVVQHEDGTRSAIMEGNEDKLILEGVLLAFNEIKAGLEAISR